MTPPSDCCHHAFYRAMPRIAPTMLSQDIRPSHAGIVPKQINKSNFFPPSGGHTILVFSYETLWQYSDNGEPPNGDVDCNGYEKSRFLTNILLYLGNDTRQGHSCYRTPIRTHIICNLQNGAIFNDPERFSKICNDTKHRAVSLRQLSFLYICPGLFSLNNNNSNNNNIQKLQFTSCCDRMVWYSRV